jgi:hypothetical protein
MKKWPFVALLLVGSAILGATVMREPIAWAAQIVDAKIVAPLDGAGNVMVHEQGTVQVAGTVGIRPAANDVTIDNPAASPVPVAVQQAAIEPVQERVRISLADGESDEEAPVYTVPAGKLLVITFVSANGGHRSTDNFVRAEVSVGSGFFQPRVNLPIHEATGQGPFAAAEAVTLYAQAGETVYARFFDSPGGTSSSSLVADFTVVGHLVDAA